MTKWFDVEMLGEEARAFVAELFETLGPRRKHEGTWAEVSEMAERHGLSDQWFTTLLRKLDNEVGCIARVQYPGRSQPGRWAKIRITTLGWQWWQNGGFGNG